MFLYMCVYCVSEYKYGRVWPTMPLKFIDSSTAYTRISRISNQIWQQKKNKSSFCGKSHKKQKKTKIGCFCGGVGGCVYVTGFMAFRSNYATYINIIMRVLLQLCQLKKSINLACVQWVCWWLRINENFPKEATKTTPECMHKVQCFVRIELYLCIHICIFMLFICFHCLYVCTTFRFWRAHTK